MSTDDQRRSSELYGEALRIARDEVPEYLLERLVEVSDGNDRLRTTTAGEIAGAWMANPASRQGYKLIAAGRCLSRAQSTVTSCSSASAPLGAGQGVAAGVRPQLVTCRMPGE